MKKENHQLFMDIRKAEIIDVKDMYHVVNGEYIVFDVETSGYDGDITEIGALHVCRGRVTRSFHTLVKAINKIKRPVLNLTGITDEMLSDAPAIEEVLPPLKVFLEGQVLVGHSLDMDLMSVNMNMIRMNCPLILAPYIDTNRLAHIVLHDNGEQRKYSVQALCETYRLNYSRFHRAIWDCEAEKTLFQVLMKEIGKEK